MVAAACHGHHGNDFRRGPRLRLPDALFDGPTLFRAQVAADVLHVSFPPLPGAGGSAARGVAAAKRRAGAKGRPKAAGAASRGNIAPPRRKAAPGIASVPPSRLAEAIQKPRAEESQETSRHKASPSSPAAPGSAARRKPRPSGPDRAAREPAKRATRDRKEGKEHHQEKKEKDEAAEAPASRPRDSNARAARLPAGPFASRCWKATRGSRGRTGGNAAIPLFGHLAFERAGEGFPGYGFDPGSNSAGHVASPKARHDLVVDDVSRGLIPGKAKARSGDNAKLSILDGHHQQNPLVLFGRADPPLVVKTGAEPLDGPAAGAVVVKRWDRGHDDGNPLFRSRLLGSFRDSGRVFRRDDAGKIVHRIPNGLGIGCGTKRGQRPKTKEWHPEGCFHEGDPWKDPSKGCVFQSIQDRCNIVIAFSPRGSQRKRAPCSMSFFAATPFLTTTRT